MRDTSGMSGDAAQAVKNINDGNTWYQRRRTQNRKILGAGISAFGTGVSGVMKAGESREKEMAALSKEKREAVEAAIRSAKLPPSQPDDRYKDEYGLPMAQPEYRGQMDKSVSAGRGDYIPPFQPPPPTNEELAKSAQSQNDANDAATAAPIGGHWTRQGFQDADMNAAVNASDIDRAQAMMKAQSLQDRTFGGLQNSWREGN